MVASRVTAWPAVLALLVLWVANPADATTWPPPRRPLTDDEQMEFAVSGSHIVGVGTLTAMGDSLDKDGMGWSWMTFDPERWLKGGPGMWPLRLYFPTISHFAQRQAFEWSKEGPVRCLIFAHLVNDPRWRYWALPEHPGFPGHGIVRLEDDPDVERRATRVIAAVRPEALARRCALVVVGHSTPNRTPLRALHGHAKGVQVRVDSVISGRAVPGQVLHPLFFGPYGLLSETGDLLLMLRPCSEGGWEVVGFGAGALKIRDGIVTDLNEPLANVVARIRAALRTQIARPAKP